MKERHITSQLLYYSQLNLNATTSGDQFTHQTANVEDAYGAHSDIKAEDFQGDRHQCGFFDARVFNLLAMSNCHLTLGKCYKKHTQQKHRVI